MSVYVCEQSEVLNSMRSDIRWIRNHVLSLVDNLTDQRETVAAAAAVNTSPANAQGDRFSATQGSHASWKVLDFFFLENSRTWIVLENHFGPRKSWKLKLKVLESPGKISLKVMHFSSGSNGKQAAIV